MGIVLPGWLAWMIVAVILVLLDLTLAGAQFILVAAALAAMGAGLASYLGVDLVIQLWIFICATILAVPVAVLLTRRYGSKDSPRVRDRGWADGREADLIAEGARVLVRLEGDTYPVRGAGGERLTPGQRVRVRHLDGITAVVDPIDPPARGPQS